MSRAHRSWVAASLAARCDVCQRSRRVRLWPVLAPELATVVPCPHCQRLEPLPVLLPPKEPE